MNIDKDKVFAYLGTKSNRSILNNVIRGSVGNFGSKVMSRLSKKVPAKVAHELAKKHGLKFNEEDKKGYGPAYYDPNTHEVTVNKNWRSKPVLLHELGHGVNSRKEGTHNNNHFKRKIPAHRQMNEDELHSVMRSEREAWVEARKLAGGKESLGQKVQRKVALKAYENNLNAMAQVQRMQSDPKYRREMLIKTGKKFLGGTVGAMAGNAASNQIWKKIKARIRYLESKSNLKPEEREEVSKLKRKLALRKGVATGVGAAAGYGLTKKYLT